MRNEEQIMVRLDVALKELAKRIETSQERRKVSHANDTGARYVSRR
jgi:hypothetical protein